MEVPELAVLPESDQASQYAMQYTHKAAARAARAGEEAAPAGRAGPWWVAIEMPWAHPPCMDAMLASLDVAGAMRAVLSHLMVELQG